MFWITLILLVTLKLLVRQSIRHPNSGVLTIFSAASASVRRGPRVESLTGPGVGVSVRGWGSADRVASRKVGRRLNSSGSRLQPGVRERLWCCGPGPRLPPGLPVFLASWAGRERCTCSPVFSGPQAQEVQAHWGPSPCSDAGKRSCHPRRAKVPTTWTSAPGFCCGGQNPYKCPERTSC